MVAHFEEWESINRILSRPFIVIDKNSKLCGTFLAILTSHEIPNVFDGSVSTGD